VQLKNKIKDIMKKFMKDANKILPPTRNKGKDTKSKGDSTKGNLLSSGGKMSQIGKKLFISKDESPFHHIE